MLAYGGRRLKAKRAISPIVRAREGILCGSIHPWGA